MQMADIILPFMHAPGLTFMQKSWTPTTINLEIFVSFIVDGSYKNIKQNVMCTISIKWYGVIPMETAKHEKFSFDDLNIPDLWHIVAMPKYHLQTPPTITHSVTCPPNAVTVTPPPEPLCCIDPTEELALVMFPASPI